MVVSFPGKSVCQQETFEHLKVIKSQRKVLEHAKWKNAPGTEKWLRSSISKIWFQILGLPPSGFVTSGKFLTSLGLSFT